MKKLLLIGCLLATLGSLGGCATVAGFGDDVAVTGNAITGTAMGY